MYTSLFPHWHVEGHLCCKWLVVWVKVVVILCECLVLHLLGESVVDSSHGRIRLDTEGATSWRLCSDKRWCLWCFSAVLVLVQSLGYWVVFLTDLHDLDTHFEYFPSLYLPFHFLSPTQGRTMAVLKELLSCQVLMPHPSESWDYRMPLNTCQEFSTVCYCSEQAFTV